MAGKCIHMYASTFGKECDEEMEKNCVYKKTEKDRGPSMKEMLVRGW